MVYKGVILSSREHFEANLATHLTPSHHSKASNECFLSFFWVGVRLRTILFHFLVLRKIFPGGSYVEVFLKWVL